jgi:tRNA-dihydrouridine synthase
MTVAVYRNGNCGLNECSRVYGVPKATIRRHAMKQIWCVNGVKAQGRQATFFGDVEDILTDHIIMLEECFGGRGLSIKYIRKLAFDLAENIKQYRKIWVFT